MITAEITLRSVTLANTNYLSISEQEMITGGTVPVSSGGTGATTAAADAKYAENLQFII